ncbi:MAG: hypothetical protein EXR72_20750 [Myxococcales bacterium]|nr:hypothetical protein [Myxococcales bacterium]
MSRPIAFPSAALALILAGGCVGPAALRPEQGPDAAVRRYLDAVRGRRYADAYALMSAGYRKDHDLATFQRALDEHRDEVDAVAARLQAGGATVELRAEARFEGGDAVPLVAEAGAWRIAIDPLDVYPQVTPVDALRSFLRALDRKRYDVLYRFVPARYRKSLSLDQLRARWEGDKRAELTGQVAEVRAHLGDPIEITGDEARLSLGEQRQTRLAREEGLWRIEALR